jgi:predicted ATPase
MTVNELDFSVVKLRAREKEIAVIQNSYRNLGTSGNCSSVRSIFVEGCSGAGKSTLVTQALKDEVCLNDGIFVYGKYDHDGLKEPYSAWVEAFADLCEVIETRKNAELNDKIQQVLGDDAPQFVRVIPSMAKLLSCPTPAVANTAPLVSENQVIDSRWEFEKLKIAFRSALEAVGCYFSVVVFIDDLQWADMGVLDLIKFLHESRSINRYMFVGAYRNDEFDENDPIQSLLLDLVQRPSSVSISLENLDLDGVNELIGGLVKSDPSTTLPLARIVFRKTDGNVFFALQLLQVLQRSNLLSFSFQTLTWKWDVAKIQEEARLSGKIGDLVATKIQCLSEDTREGLQIAACLGNHFDSRIVDEMLSVKWQTRSLEDSWSHGMHEDDSVSDVKPDGKSRWEIAMNARMIDPTKEPGAMRFKFAHDRIQQAAYNLTPVGHDRMLLHLRIGRFLLRQHRNPKTTQEWMLLVAVNQLNRSIDLIEDPDERNELASLNFEAAERVALKSAFFMAAAFLRVGLGLLGDTRWTDHYPLTLQMSTMSAKYEYCCGNFEPCKNRVGEVLIQARNLADKIDVYFTLIDSLGVQKKGNDALKVGCDLLNALGFKFPKKVGIRHLLVEYLQCKRLLKGRSDDDLVALREMTEKNSANALKVMTHMTTFAWFDDKMEDFALLIIRMLKVSLQFGATKYTASAYSMFGVVFSKFFELQEAQRMGRLGIRMLERFGEQNDLSPRVIFTSTVFLAHLKSPLHDLLNPLLKAYKLGLKTGDLAYGMIGSSAYCICYFMCGLPLSVLNQDAENFATEMIKYKQLTALSPCLLHRQAALNLMGASHDVLRLQGEAIENIDDFLKQGTDVENARTDQVYTSLMMQIAYYMGNLTLALEMVARNLKHGDEDFPFFISTAYPYWRGLIYFALVQEGQKKYMRKARSQMRILSKYVNGGMVNCHYMLLLLEAENAATVFLQKHSAVLTESVGSAKEQKNRKGRENLLKSIRELYDKAIQSASRSGFIQAGALARERAGLFVLRSKSRSAHWWVGFYLNGACELYSEWGAVANVQRLQHEFSSLMANERVRGPGTSHVKGMRRFQQTSAAPLHHQSDFFELSDEEGGFITSDNGDVVR